MGLSSSLLLALSATQSVQGMQGAGATSTFPIFARFPAGSLICVDVPADCTTEQLKHSIQDASQGEHLAKDMMIQHGPDVLRPNTPLADAGVPCEAIVDVRYFPWMAQEMLNENAFPGPYQRTFVDQLGLDQVEVRRVNRPQHPQPWLNRTIVLNNNPIMDEIIKTCQFLNDLGHNVTRFGVGRYMIKNAAESTFDADQ